MTIQAYNYIIIIFTVHISLTYIRLYINLHNTSIYMYMYVAK